MKRSKKNPIITRRDIPLVKPHLVDVTSVFNPGAVKYKDKYLLILRVQNRGRETFLLKAVSDNGEDFTVDDRIIRFEGIEKVSEKIYHIYDPRITRLDEKYYIMVAMDTDDTCRLGLAVTEDFNNYQWLGIVSDDDNRNGVLFPEKINGQYYRLDRPNRTRLGSGVSLGSAVYLSDSDDLRHWWPLVPVLEGRLHYWDERLGAGPPPVKTAEGWLLVYHGIATHFQSVNIYQAGVALFDLDNPARLIARSRYNILEPRETYELTGQVPNVVFPGGMIVERYDANDFAEPDSPVYLYYGAADTSVCLAVATVKELLNACKYGYKALGNVLDLNLLRSPTYPDPDADRGRHEFTYSLLPHSGDLIHSDVMAHAARLNQGLELFEGYKTVGQRLPAHVTGEGLSLEVVKKAEKENFLILRIVETRGRDSKGMLIVEDNSARLVETDLMEWHEYDGYDCSQPVELALKPFEIMTFKLKTGQA